MGSGAPHRRSPRLAWPRWLRHCGAAAAVAAPSLQRSPSRMHPTLPSRLQGEDDGSALLPVGPWLAAREGEKPVRQSSGGRGDVPTCLPATLRSCLANRWLPQRLVRWHRPTLAGRPLLRQVGVYAVHDSKRNLQYVGYARNIVLAVRVSERWTHGAHKRGLQTCAAQCRSRGRARAAGALGLQPAAAAGRCWAAPPSMAPPAARHR